MDDITTCKRCGAEVSGAEARKQMFGKVCSHKPLLCKNCREEVRAERISESLRIKKAQLKERYECEKQETNWSDVDGETTKSKPKISNAAKLKEAQDTYADKQLQKEIDDMIGL